MLRTLAAGWWQPGSRSKRRLVTGSKRAVGPTVRRLAPYAYLFVIAMLAAGVHIARYTEFSPIDELRHVDYAMRASSFHAPRLGDVLSQDAMREEACRGLDLPWEDQPCNTKKFAPLHFRDLGYQTATAHPPTYYLGAGFFARAAEGLGLSSSFLDPARVFSALLFAAGLMVAFAAGRLAGIRSAPLLAALTFVPVVGTLCGLRDAAADQRRGDYPGVALNLLSIVPVVGGMAKALELARHAQRLKRGWVVSNKRRAA